MKHIHSTLIFALLILICESGHCQHSSVHAIELQVDSVFHSPVKGKFKKRFDLPADSGHVYSQIHIALDVKTGPWNLNKKGETRGNHSIFWFHRGEKWPGNLFGYVNIFGPEKNFLKMSTNADLPRKHMRAKTAAAVFHPGETYHFDYVYDTERRLYHVNVMHSDTLFVQIQDSTTAEAIPVIPPGFFIIFGHSDDEAGPEVPTVGWEYSNLHIEIQ